jgi:hypothetical protein
MSKYFLDISQFNVIAESSKDEFFRNFAQFVTFASPHKLYEIYSSSDNMVVQVDENQIIVGKSFLADSSYLPQQYNQLLSLNCGNFGCSIGEKFDEGKISYLRARFINYITTLNPTNLHLQDFGDDSLSFTGLTKLGYSGFWIPNVIYSEGSSKLKNSGLVSFVKRDYEKTNSVIFMSVHQANLPKITNYMKNVRDADLIMVNCSLYQAFINTHAKTISIFTNTYISPFSRAKDRLQNILSTVKNIKQIKKDLILEYPDFTIEERFTGDMNIYGANSLHGPFGLKANPWSFGLSFLSSLITQRNIPNENELTQLQQNLDNLGYQFVPENKPTNQTIFIDIEKYTPLFLKPFFKNKKVGWQLDLCIAPKDDTITLKIDNEPFGGFDHSSLTIDLASK